LRASGQIVIHCTVSDPQKSPQTSSGSHIEHLDEKMGISRFWLDARMRSLPNLLQAAYPHPPTPRGFTMSNSNHVTLLIHLR